VDDDDAAEEADPERLMAARMQADGGRGGAVRQPIGGGWAGGSEWFTLVAAALNFDGRVGPRPDYYR